MKTKTPSRQRGLLALLGVVALSGVVVGIKRYQRTTWLEKATIDELSQAATKNESDVEVFLKLAERAREREEWPRAARAFQHACELAPDRIEGWVGWARSMYEFTDFAAADAILSDFIQRNPNHGIAHLERAALRRDAKRNDKAWTDAGRAIQLLPTEGKAWALRGDLNIDMGTFREAHADFSQAKKFLTDSPWPLMGLYHSSIEMKSLPEAEAAARELRKRFPQTVEGRFYLGEVLLLGAKGDAQIDEAVRVLEEASPLVEGKDKPSDWAPTLNLLLGRAYYAKKDFPHALTRLKASVEATPDNPDALFYLGRTYRALGDSVAADKALKEHRVLLQNVAFVRKQVALLNTNPDDEVVRLGLARWYRERKAYRSALIHYEELAERNQGGEAARAELAEIRSKLGITISEGSSDAKAP